MELLGLKCDLDLTENYSDIWYDIFVNCNWVDTRWP